MEGCWSINSKSNVYPFCASWVGYSANTCLASPANFIYGRVLATVLSHVTIMPVLLRTVNNFLGQVIGNESEGKYNTVNNSSSWEVTFQKCLNSGITLFSSKYSNKSQTFATGPYQRLHEARPRRVVYQSKQTLRIVFMSRPSPSSDCTSRGSVRYSDRAIFRQVDIPTGRYSDRAIFRQVVIPTGLYFDRAIFRQVVILKGLGGNKD